MATGIFIIYPGIADSGIRASIDIIAEIGITAGIDLIADKGIKAKLAPY